MPPIQGVRSSGPLTHRPFPLPRRKEQVGVGLSMVVSHNYRWQEPAIRVPTSLQGLLLCSLCGHPPPLQTPLSEEALLALTSHLPLLSTFSTLRGQTEEV